MLRSLAAAVAEILPRVCLRRVLQSAETIEVCGGRVRGPAAQWRDVLNNKHSSFQKKRMCNNIIMVDTAYRFVVTTTNYYSSM